MEGGFWMRRSGTLGGKWSSRIIGRFVEGILGVSFDFTQVSRPGVILAWPLLHSIMRNVFMLLADSSDKTPKHFR